MPQRRGCTMLFLLVAGLLCLLVLWVHFRNQPPDISVPTPPMPAVNGYDDLVRAGQMAIKMKHKSPDAMLLRPGQPVRYADLKAMHDEAQPALDLLQTALRKPFANPPVRTYDLSSPRYKRCKEWAELARVVVGDALYYESRGQYLKAADARLDCMEIGAAGQTGAPHTESLVGCYIGIIGAQALPFLLPKLSPSELKHVCSRLERINERRPAPAEAIREEGLLFTAGMAALCAAPEYRGIRAIKRIIAPEGPFWAIRFILGDKTRWLSESADYYESLANAAAGPYTGNKQVPKPRNALADYLLDSAEGVTRSHARAEALCDLLLLEAALRRYVADHHQYPEGLSSLAPEYLPEVPVDPYGGKPFRYRTLGGGKDFMLYSIGQDLVDNGGKRGRNPVAGTDLTAKGFWTRSEPPEVSGAPRK